MRRFNNTYVVIGSDTYTHYARALSLTTDARGRDSADGLASDSSTSHADSLSHIFKLLRMQPLQEEPIKQQRTITDNACIHAQSSRIRWRMRWAKVCGILWRRNNK